VWLAYLSKPAFGGRKTPFRDPGLCMAEPSTVDEVSFTQGDISPRFMKWHNARVDERQSRQSTSIEGEFKWLEATNLPGGVSVPIESQLVMSIIDADRQRKITSITHLLVHQIAAPGAEPRQLTKIQGRNVVHDYRLANIFHRRYLTYDVRDGNIPSTKSIVVNDAVLRQYGTKAGQHSRGPFWVLFAMTSLAFIFAIYARSRKQNDVGF